MCALGDEFGRPRHVLLTRTGYRQKAPIVHKDQPFRNCSRSRIIEGQQPGARETGTNDARMEHAGQIHVMDEA